MLELLVIADDFTGALDTGVQFASDGIETRVIADRDIDFETAASGIQVLVLDVETRHLSEEEAYQTVFAVTERACRMGIPHIYKKTDSALRGNVGSELKAVLDATGTRSLHFLPAFPRMNRITRDGIHYIDGTPVHESVFGGDPFDPVRCSSIKDLLSGEMPVTCVGDMEQWRPEAGVMVYDACEDSELKEKGEFLREKGELYTTAGCAGFAGVLAQLLGLGGRKPKQVSLEERFFMVCGSVNPITRAQVEYAERHGFSRIRMSPEQKLDAGFYETETGRRFLDKWYRMAKEHPRCIMDSNDWDGSGETLDYARRQGLSLEEVRMRISSTLGYILKELIGMGLRGTLMIAGGDCLAGFMKQIGCRVIIPVCEVASGVVLSQVTVNGKNWHVISKSGGFGAENLLTELADSLTEREEEIYAG